MTLWKTVTYKKGVKMKITTIEQAQELIGKTFGPPGLQRMVTRIENLKASSTGYIIGEIYWLRPGGKERSKSMWLPYFVKWVNQQATLGEVIEFETVHDIEMILSNFPEETLATGSARETNGILSMTFIVRKDDGKD